MLPEEAMLKKCQTDTDAFLSLWAAINTRTVAARFPGKSCLYPVTQAWPSTEKQRSLTHRSHSLEDLSALAQQRLQVGIAQGPVEAVSVSFGLSD